MHPEAGSHLEPASCFWAISSQRKRFRAACSIMRPLCCHSCRLPFARLRPPPPQEVRRGPRGLHNRGRAENPRPPVVPGRPTPPPPAAVSRTAGVPGGDIFALGLPVARPAAPPDREREPFAELWSPPAAPAPATP